MPKPSIFSNNYDKQMKKRKRIIIMIIVAIVIFFLFILSGALKKSGSKEEIVKNKNVSKKVQQKEVQIKEENHNTISKQTRTDDIKSYNAKLSNGMEIKLLYNIVNNEKQYIKVEPNDISYTISPSKKYICLVEEQTQKMSLFDIDGNEKDISKNKYISSNGQSFTRENTLKLNPNYIWCKDPIFLNDNTIVYISQLPWFNKEDIKYLWQYDINNNSHINNFESLGEVSGRDIKYGNITQEGLKLTVDGTEKNIAITK